MRKPESLFFFGSIRQKDLLDACDPFARVANIIDALPEKYRLADNTALHDYVPGAWPTIGDIRRVRDALVAIGWTSDYEAEKKDR